VTDSSGNVVDVADVETDPVYLQKTAGKIDQTAAYENGAVLLGQRDTPESWTMSERPSWAIRTNSTGHVQSVFFTTIATKGNGVVSGQRTSARLVFETVGRDSTAVRNAEGVNVTVESPRSRAWEEYLGRVDGVINGSDLSVSGDTVSLEIDKDGFEGGNGSVNHRTRTVRTEVTAR
jgi:hypothetical protein